MKHSVTMAAGKYFLGDPCYAVPNDLWHPLLDSCDYFNEPLGKITKDGVEYTVLGFGTAYGDGSYEGSDGFSYPVDAGLIGLTPLALCTDADFNSELGTIVEFVEPTLCTNDGGEMFFGDIYINTDDDSYEEEDEGDWDDEFVDDYED